MADNQELQRKERSNALIAILSEPEKAREFERSLTLSKIVETALPLCEVMRNTSSRLVAQSIDAALVKLVTSVNVSQNLNDIQIQTIVEDLIDKYPNESIEDFILVFKKARQGEFGTIYSLHSAVIFSWMEFYLEEKYQALERNLMKERDDMYKRPEKMPETGEGYAEFQEWAKTLKQEKVVRPLSDEDVKREGQSEPPTKKAIFYPSSPESKEAEIKAKIELGRKIHELSKQHPEKSLEELKQMINPLTN